MAKGLDRAVCREIVRLYEAAAGRRFEVGDRFWTQDGLSILAGEEGVPEGAVWCPGLEDLLRLGLDDGQGSVTLRTVVPEPEKGAKVDVLRREWLAEEGDGRRRRSGRGGTPEEATAAWLIARKTRPL